MAMATSTTDIKKARTYFWGSSHLCPKHHFPEKMAEYWKTQTLSNWFKAPEYHAHGGAKLNDRLVNNIKTVMKDNGNAGEKQVHVLLIGGNNIRKAQRGLPIDQVDNVLKAEIDKMCQMLADICQCAVEVPGVKFFIASPIPSPKTQDRTWKAFRWFHDKMKATIAPFAASRSVMYKNVTIGFLEDHMGNVNSDLFDSDGIHLNPSGAASVANSIGQILYNMDRKFFH